MSVVFIVQKEGDNAKPWPREPASTLAFVDTYCTYYCAMFPNVRPFGQFTHLELSLVAKIKRKSLPRLAQTTKADPQALTSKLS
jgi:SRSO17 transposase